MLMRDRGSFRKATTPSCVHMLERAADVLRRLAPIAADTLYRSAPFIPVFVCIENYVGTISSISGRSMQPTFCTRGLVREPHPCNNPARARTRSLAFAGHCVML